MIPDFARWRARLGYNGMEVKKAADAIGISGTTKAAALHTGKQELTKTERLAMAAVLAGLPEWTPETDQEIADMGEVLKLFDRLQERRVNRSSEPASAA